MRSDTVADRVLAFMRGHVLLADALLAAVLLFFTVLPVWTYTSDSQAVISLFLIAPLSCAAPGRS